ncbi:TMAO/DMSO reductase [compost metagenome]
MTVIPLEEALEGVLLAFKLNGKPLPVENGGPARLVAPRLYGWKNAKWVSRITVHEEYQDGYWEALAYHERGLAAAQERFKVRNPEVAREGSLPGPPRPLKP